MTVSDIETETGSPRPGTRRSPEYRQPRRAGRAFGASTAGLGAVIAQARRRIAGECSAASDAAEAAIAGHYAWRLAAIEASGGGSDIAAARRALIAERDACLSVTRAKIRAGQAERERAEIGILVAAAIEERSRRRAMVRSFRRAGAALERARGNTHKAKRTPKGRPSLHRRQRIGHVIG